MTRNRNAKRRPTCRQALRVWRIALLSSALGMVPAPAFAAGTLLHTVDFEAPGDFHGEDGTYSQVDSNVDTCEYDGTCGTDSLAIIESPEPVRAGKRAVKVTHAKGDLSARGARAEMKLAQQLTHEYHVSFWYGFSVFIPNDWQFSSRDHSLVFQIHAGSSGPGSSPVVGVRIGDNGNWVITTERDGTPDNQVTDELGTAPIQKGVWNDWVMHPIWSSVSDVAPSVSDGVLEIWLNGNKLVDKQNWRTLYPSTETDKPTPTLYVKLGYYGADTNRVLFHDELRIAKGDGDLSALVSPTSTPTDGGSEWFRPISVR